MSEPKDIRSYIKNFPELPGVYLMKDVSGEIIYIGKAINLKSRIKSYFEGRDDRVQIEPLLERLADVDFIVTKDERQALILEADLVRRNQPRYNIRLKDDKAPLLIRVDLTHRWPRLQLVRKKLNDGAVYFGPYPFSYEARTLLDVIERTLLLRTCTDKVLNNRVRPCLQYQIKRCSGPCCLPVDKEEYDDWVKSALQILSGEVEEVVDRLEYSMSQASEQLRFEDAALIRDRLSIIKKLKSDSKETSFGESNIDAFGFYREGNLAEVSILKTNQGRLFNSFSFGFTDVSISNEEIISSVFQQFYELNSSYLPAEVLLSSEVPDSNLLKLFYSDKFEKSVKLIAPKKGMKAKLLELANLNAKENFEVRFGGKSKLDRVLESLKVTLGLEQLPRIIECADISHIQGKATVGSIICFKDGRPDNSRYRYFHLSQEGKPDDFASMNEIVRRHLIRSGEEGVVSDLLVIDGGPPQLAQAIKVKNELGLKYPSLISIAKKRVIKGSGTKNSSPREHTNLKKPERIYIEDNPVPIILDRNNEVLKLIERVRNEAHRSAISFHRKTRAKLQFVSPLDKVVGLGPKRKMSLLRTFGSLDGLRRAEEDELVNKGKITRKLAEAIKRELNK